MQLIETVCATLLEDHPGINPVKFGQNPMSSFIEVKMLTDKAQYTRGTVDKDRSQNITLSTLRDEDSCLKNEAVL